MGAVVSRARRSYPIEPGQPEKVYFLRSGARGPIKIGKARDVQRRVDEIKAGNPYELRVLAVMPGGRAEERELHERFAHLRLRGEWFRPAAELRDFVKQVRESQSGGQS